MNKDRYRKELEKFKNKKFVIRARVDKRRTKDYTSRYGNTYKVETMLLKDVKCGVIRNKKFYVIERIHHVWLSAETSKLVTNFQIKPGHEVMFGATVTEYTYKNGKNQLGVVQTSKKHNFK